MSRIIPRSTWGARHANGVGNRNVGSLEKYFHHTVTKHLPATATPAQEQAQMRVIESIGQQRFGAGISYQFIIFPSGRIYEGASVDRVSYHSGSGRNTRGTSICLAGNYETNQITDTVIRSIVWLLQHGVTQGWWGDPALTESHRDFRPTSCPGKHAHAAFDAINAMGRSKASAPATIKPAGSTPAPSTGKDWLSMATEAEVRKIVQEETEALYDRLITAGGLSWAKVGHNGENLRQLLWEAAKGAQAGYINTNAIKNTNTEVVKAIATVAQSQGLTPEQVSALIDATAKAASEGAEKGASEAVEAGVTVDITATTTANKKEG